MKKNILGIVALVAALFVAAPANAQFAYGIKAGMNMTKVDLSNTKTAEAVLGNNANNAAGFFVGATAEFTVPIIGIGFDVSALYDQKKLDIDGAESQTLQYVSVPVNVKYSLGLGNLANVFVATGPQASFNIGDKSWKAVKDEAVNPSTLEDLEWSWNVGAGVTLAKHYRVAYNYNIGLGKTGELKRVYDDGLGGTKEAVQKIKGNNTHQISVTYLF